MLPRGRSLAGAAILALAAAAVFVGGVEQGVSADHTVAPQNTFVYRVTAPTDNDVQGLIFRDFDVLEARDGNDVFVLGTRDVGARLTAAGYRPVVDQVMPAPQWAPPARTGQAPTLTAADVNETYYGGYHTVNAQYAHLDQVVQQHPDLATVVDYGDSWRKTKGRGGYDLKAICLTKRTGNDCQRTPSVSKPRFFLMSQIHAREITTGDVSWRWIDFLAGGYGTNTDATNLLNTTEIWVVPIVNPDGVDIVQQGGNSPRLQRKNGDDAQGTCGGTGQLGVDLNRNNGNHWGGASTSSSPCSEVYKGPRADSEVETTALESLWRSLYPDKRGTSDTAAAPADTRGVFITMHSFSNLVLFPWAFNNGVHSGNDAKLRAMARDMAGIAGSGWRFGQPGDVLYNASGSSDDWLYGDLGVASFTFEIGPGSGSCSGFLPAFSCQTSKFWPTVRPMLLYAAKKAPAPYA